MSVINFSFQEIEELADLMSGNPSVRKIIQEDPFYLERLKKNNYKKLETEKYVEDFIGRLIWYSFVANQLAFSLQYKEEPKLFEYSFKGTPPIPNNKNKFIYEELRGLNYNIYTNDGNYFIADCWKNCLESIVEKLKDLPPVPLK